MLGTTRRRSARGFSLLELLLVLTLAPVIFFTVYSNFSAGIRLWERLKRPVAEEDIVLNYEKCRHDFENMMRYSPIAFVGDIEEVSFPTAVTVQKDLGGSRGIGEAHYYFMDSSNSLFRETRDISEVYRDSPGHMQRLAAEVSGSALSYLTYDKLSDQYAWSDSFKSSGPGGLPLAVKMSYIHRPTGRKVEHTFFVPAGGSFT